MSGLDQAGEPLVDEFVKLSARMGVADERLPAQTLLKVVAAALAGIDRQIEVLRGEVAALAARIDALDKP
jgi:hypothetical protein